LCEEEDWIEVKNKDGKIGLVPKVNLQVNYSEITKIKYKNIFKKIFLFNFKAHKYKAITRFRQNF
jgi:hypothetical protein